MTHQTEDPKHAQESQESDDVDGRHGAKRRVEDSNAELDEVGEEGEQLKDRHGQEQQLAPSW